MQPPPPPRPHLPKSCHTYPIMMKLGTIISKFKKIQKIYKSGDTRLEIRIFSPGNRKSSYRKKYRYILHFGTKFPILVIFSECSQIFSINMVAILMMSAKMASLGLLKIKLFWNKDYDVIISVHDVTRKSLSRVSSYIIDVVR